jgi:small subunit ribosomal protein S4
MLNGRKTDIPSARVRTGDTVSVRPESLQRTYFKDLRQNLDDRQVPRWLSLDVENMSARVLSAPEREDIDVTLNEQLIVEYYSR